MPTLRSYSSLDTLPSYLTAAYGLDTSWMKQGRCHPEACPSDLDALAVVHRKNLWSVDLKGTFGPQQIPCRELVAVAELECRRCPVQWECVTYAISGELAFGTWGVRQGRRKRLAELPNWKELVTAAKAAGKPVDSLVPVAVRRRSANSV